jgi:hypothetical protein
VSFWLFAIRPGAEFILRALSQTTLWRGGWVVDS